MYIITVHEILKSLPFTMYPDDLANKCTSASYNVTLYITYLKTEVTIW